MDIILSKPDNKFLINALHWHEDEELNKSVGAGIGLPGKVRAHNALKELTLNPPDNGVLLVVSMEEEPVGYVYYSDIAMHRKMAELHITIAPEFQSKGIGKEAMIQALDHAFKSDLYRVTFSPFKNNDRAVGLAKKLGFTLEAFTKSSAWVDGSPRDQALFRMIRPEWTKHRKRLVNK